MMALRDTLLCVVFAAALPMGQIMFKQEWGPAERRP